MPRRSLGFLALSLLQGTFSVVRSQGGMSCTQTNPVRCTMPLLTREEAFAGATVAVRLDRPGTHHAMATVSTSTPEGPVENNTARHAVVQAGLPEIWGSLIQEDSTLDPGGEGSFRLGVTNDGAPATNVVLRAKIEDGGEILRAVPTDWGFGPPTAECAIAGGEVTCRTGCTCGSRGWSTTSAASWRRESRPR